jgi:hypothetical protein
MQSRQEIRDSIPFPSEEIIAYTPIDTLFVLVHPLNEPLYTEVVFNHHVQKVRKQFFNAALSRFRPSSEKDVLLVIPNNRPSTHDFRLNVMKTESQMEMFDDPYSWISLYEQEKKNSPFPKNIMLGENVPLLSIPSGIVEKHLEQKGFSINADTKIILGGELIENCIADTAMDFLSLAQVPFVLIDVRASLGITDYARHGKIPEDSIVTAFRRLRAFGYSVAGKGDYMHVERP